MENVDKYSENNNLKGVYNSKIEKYIQTIEFKLNENIIDSGYNGIFKKINMVDKDMALMLSLYFSSKIENDQFNIINNMANDLINNINNSDYIESNKYIFLKKTLIDLLYEKLLTYTLSDNIYQNILLIYLEIVHIENKYKITA